MRESLYRGLDRSALDQEYNAAAFVGDTARYFKAYIEQSAEVRHRLRCACDISYGRAEGQTLDIFFSGQNRAPVHIFFHGGGFRSQDKSNFSFIAEPLVKAGLSVVIPNYDLCPAVTLDEIIRQCRACVAWVYENARIFGGNPNAITISGHSAGATIVAMLLETYWADFRGTPEDVIKSAVAVSGLYDQEPRRLSYLNADLHLDPEQAMRNSPFFRTPRRRVPYLIAVSDGETKEYIRQSKDYANALVGRSYDVQFMLVPDHHHYDILYPLIDSAHPLGKALLELARLDE